MPGAATTERQLVSTRSMPCSLKVGTSTPGRRCGEVTPMARSLPVPFVLAVTGDAGGHVGAEDSGERLAAAGERYVVDLGCVGTGRGDEQRCHDVIDAAGRAAGEGDLGDILLHCLGQFV